jgi:hypothetical protein
VPTNEDWCTLDDYLGDQNVTGGNKRNRHNTLAKFIEGTTNEAAFTPFRAAYVLHGTFDHMATMVTGGTNEYLGYCARAWVMYHDYSGFYETTSKSWVGFLSVA